MCRHIWQTVDKVRVCPRCGMTVSLNGKIIHDKELPGLLRRKGKSK